MNCIFNLLLIFVRGGSIGVSVVCLWWWISQRTTLLCTPVVCANAIVSERRLCARLRIYNYYYTSIYILHRADAIVMHILSC